jgi:putative peptidoglycan lipid II flippase
VLLHQRQMVSLASLDFKEMGRCLLAGLASGVAVWAAIWAVGRLPLHLLHSRVPAQIRWADLFLLILGCGLWVVVARWVLEKSGSVLPRVAMQRLGLR